MNKPKIASAQFASLDRAVVERFRRYWISEALPCRPETCDTHMDNPKGASFLSLHTPTSDGDALVKDPAELFQVHLTSGKGSTWLDVPPGPCRLQAWRKDSSQKILVVHVFLDRADLAQLEDFPWGHLGWIVAEPKHIICFD